MSVPPPSSIWRHLFGCTSRRSRVYVGAGAALGALGRLAVVGTALQIAHADARLATICGVAAGLAFVTQRVVLASARVAAECDLHRSVARALLDSDVLGVPAEDLQRVVFETNGHGRHVFATTLPAFASDVVASVVLAPLLASLFPARVLAIAALGLVVVMTSLVVLRRVTARVQDRVLEASQRVIDAMLVAVEGRLELVARGGEVAFAHSLETVLSAYARIASRSALASSLLGRVPLVIGAAAVAMVVAVDGASRDALASTVLAEALVLAASMPALLGVVLGVHELVRSGRVLAPLATILGAPRRPELASIGVEPPALPAAFALERVTFAYGAGEPLALSGVDATWKVGEPLVVVGPNGGGKSTVLKLLLGLRAPSSGVVRLDGKELGTLDLGALRRHVAYLPQRPYLGEAYGSVRDAMRLGRPDATDDAIAASLERATLLQALRARQADPLSVRIGELSAGQLQRVALARILLQDAQLVLLDEPDANLDRDGLRLVASLVGELVTAGKMVAVAAHATELSDLSPSLLELTTPRARSGNEEEGHSSRTRTVVTPRS